QDDFSKLKETDYLKIYLDNIELNSYQELFNFYLEDNVFNKKDYNIEDNGVTYGVIDYFTTFNDDKTYLKHKTSLFMDGISYRFSVDDAKTLITFEKIKESGVLPNPLPIFIDKNEFKNTDDMIKIFKTESFETGEKLSYSQILKKVFEKDNNKVLKNYYLLFFQVENKELVIKDFDFVSMFRYSLEKEHQNPKVLNLYELFKDGKLRETIEIKDIFYFEGYIIRTIFNNSLVHIDEKKNSYKVKYFDDIDPIYVSGGDSVYQMIIKYRKAFYDYIYKSKTEAISCYMFDEIMWNSIIGDLRKDELNDKKQHTKEYSIKEKLNIWFSLYNYFTNSYGRLDMSSKIPELLERMKRIANNQEEHFESVEEFAFGAGQIIYYLLNQSKASERTHALLEPFIQKVQSEQLQNSISQAINAYKHEISFGKGRFERLASEVLAFDTDENLKNYQRLLLAGYFASPVIYEKKEKDNESILEGEDNE
ncbi:hypothetical protein JXR93_09585, partial [bacterium]|nr:hypothetical protein [bacterium]